MYYQSKAHDIEVKLPYLLSLMFAYVNLDCGRYATLGANT